MVTGILLKDKRFETKDQNNLLEPLTENTIIVCNNYQLMSALADEIVNTINANAEHNDYCCDEEDVGKAKYVLNFGLQKVIDINGQRITLCLEPAMIYKATKIEDIWFCDWLGEDDTYRESVYPIVIFNGSDEVYTTQLSKGIYYVKIYGADFVTIREIIIE